MHDAELGATEASHAARRGGRGRTDRLLLVSFNVVQELEDEWLAAGNRIVQSVKIVQ